MKFEKRDTNKKYTVVADGFISMPDFGEGRLIPIALLKSPRDSQLEFLLEHHKESSPGDVTVKWSISISQIRRRQKIFLSIKFTNPVEVDFHIEFNLEKDSSLVHSIFRSRCLGIGLGGQGDKVSDKYRSTIIIEVPDTGMDKWWGNILRKHLNKVIRKSGASKKDLPRLVQNRIQAMDEKLSLRRTKMK